MKCNTGKISNFVMKQVKQKLSEDTPNGMAC